MAVGQGVPSYDPFTVASGGEEVVPADWMPASDCRSLVREDPCALWLDWYGDQHGFTPAVSDYSFNDFVFRKGKELEAAWLHIYGDHNVRVCQHDGNARLARNLKVTLEMMNDGAPVIVHPALWWAPEKIYGAPDLIALSTWIEQNFPNALPPAEVNAGATGQRNGHYIALDVKIKTKIDENGNKKDLEMVTAQLSMYSYMLGHLQGYMPQSAFVICRDRVTSPFRIELTSALNSPLDQSLASIRDHWRDIRLNGNRYLPWKDDVVEVNLSADNEKWDSSKKVIAADKTPGGDVTQVLKISLKHKKTLTTLGFPSLNSLLAVDPALIPFDQCKGIGNGKTAKLLRAILDANRTGKPFFPPKSVVPTPKKFEFFVDYEFFQNLNFDCQTQWPTLHGCSMIFMAGVGYEENGGFKCSQFIAETESPEAELKLLTDFVSFIEQKTGGACCDGSQTAFYHWSPAEDWQSEKAADTHKFPAGHTLRRLPWNDLRKIFLDGPAALPGCLNSSTLRKHWANLIRNTTPRGRKNWRRD